MPRSALTHYFPVVVNGRYRNHQITGVQRYAHEIVTRLGEDVEVVTAQCAKGIKGHLWEQTVLSHRCGGRLLWSPCATGPLRYRRQVVTFHDLFPIEFPQWYHRGYAAWYRIAMRRLAASALHLIAVSEYTKSRIVGLLGVPPEKVTVIYNGAHTKDRASDEQVQAARCALQLPEGRYVLSLSSLERRKNLRVTLEAWSSTHQQLPEDVWLVLAGPKADSSVYGKQAISDDVPRVIFTGYVPEEHLAGLYSGASLFVYPSLAEGFGLPLAEAMSCGVRCITSRSSSLPEVGGDAVDYVDPQMPSELASRILARLREQDGPPQPVRAVMDRGRRFCWDTAAARTREVLYAAAADSVRGRATACEESSALRGLHS